MIVIVSNKQKSALDNANIDAIKDLNGLFNVQDLINNFKNYFFTRMVIDATSIVDFTNPEVLKQLANGIGSEKLVILLPPKPEPPLRFLETLVNIGIYNFSTNINELVNLIDNPNDYDAVNKKIHNTGPKGDSKAPMSNNSGSQNNNNPDKNMKKDDDVPQSARKSDIINLSDFVVSKTDSNEEEGKEERPQSEDINSVSSPMDINSVTPIGDMQGQMNQQDNESNKMDSMNSNAPVEGNMDQGFNYNSSPNNNPNINSVNNINDSFGGSFLNGNQQGGFIGFNENKGLIVGFRNVTEHAGTTTLLYKLKETIESNDRKRVALVEVGSNDFMFFRLNDVSTISENELDSCLNNYQTRYDYIFVDLNSTNNDSICDFVLYLVEPSKIKINKLIVKNRNIFSELKGKYVVLNKSMLSENEKGIFSQEANLPFYASVAPFNDRVATNAIDELISKINNEKSNQMANAAMSNSHQGFIGF